MVVSFDIYQNVVLGEYELVYQKLAFQVFCCPNYTKMNFIVITFLKLNKQAAMKNIYIKVLLTCKDGYGKLAH